MFWKYFSDKHCLTTELLVDFYLIKSAMDRKKILPYSDRHLKRCCHYNCRTTAQLCNSSSTRSLSFRKSPQGRLSWGSLGSPLVPPLPLEVITSKYVNNEVDDTSANPPLRGNLIYILSVCDAGPPAPTIRRRLMLKSGQSGVEEESFMQGCAKMCAMMRQTLKEK